MFNKLTEAEIKEFTEESDREFVEYCPASALDLITMPSSMEKFFEVWHHCV